MSVDVKAAMERQWAELGAGVKELDAGSGEAAIENFLDRVVVLRGVEIQTLYPGLEDLDDEADRATAAGTKRSDRIQSTMEKLSLPPSASAWRNFASAVRAHAEQSPEDVGARLEALSDEDRAELGELVKTSLETLS